MFSTSECAKIESTFFLMGVSVAEDISTYEPLLHFEHNIN